MKNTLLFLILLCHMWALISCDTSFHTLSDYLERENETKDYFHDPQKISSLVTPTPTVVPPMNTPRSTAAPNTHTTTPTPTMFSLPTKPTATPTISGTPGITPRVEPTVVPTTAAGINHGQTPAATADAATPTPYVTVVPDITMTPTPTLGITATPTSTSGLIPTSTPTSTPALSQTATPTSIPTATPTSTPTSIPTATPTSTPTSIPTATPTSTPTSIPTATPTSTPTSIPTATPTSTPIDLVAPEAGSSGTMTAYGVFANSLDIGWDPASDNLTTQENLKYKLVMSLSNNLNTLDDALSNGQVIRDWGIGYTRVLVDSLSSATTYFFNVVVMDEAGNMTLYHPVWVSTLNGNIIDDTFNGNTTAAPPLGYYSAGSIIVEDPSPTDKSAYLADNNPNGISYIQKTFSAQAGGVYTLEFKVKPLQTTGRLYVSISSGTGTPVLLSFYSDGIITAFTADGYTNLCTYNSDRWYDIRVDIDLNTGYCDFFVDSVHYAYEPFYSSTTSIDLLTFETTLSGVNEAFLIDDVKLY